MNHPGKSPSDPAGEAPAVPRHAATVILLRPGQATLGSNPEGTAGAPPEVFMLRRSAKSPFMPSTLVFPGGRLDDEDGDPSEAATWESAAKRECREEAGVDLGPRALEWFDTWLTPSAESRRRYLARFFLAALEPGEGDEAEADGHETHAGRWAGIDDHLTAWREGEVDLPPPTVCILLRLQAWAQQTSQAGATTGREAMEAIITAATALDPGGVILPKVILEGGGPVILMPHDDAYGDAPGVRPPSPPRAYPDCPNASSAIRRDGARNDPTTLCSRAPVPDPRRLRIVEHGQGRREQGRRWQSRWWQGRWWQGRWWRSQTRLDRPPRGRRYDPLRRCPRGTATRADLARPRRGRGRDDSTSPTACIRPRSSPCSASRPAVRSCSTRRPRSTNGSAVSSPNKARPTPGSVIPPSR